VIRLVGCFLPSGDAVCRFKRNVSAKSEYHGKPSVCSSE
jgi:hypothetical protein